MMGQGSAATISPEAYTRPGGLVEINEDYQIFKGEAGKRENQGLVKGIGVLERMQPELQKKWTHLGDCNPMTYEVFNFKRIPMEIYRLSSKDRGYFGRWKNYYMTCGNSNFWDKVDEWNQ
jgi:hypothetical protein